MIGFTDKYAYNYLYSQNGEEGIAEECLLRMRVSLGDVNCVEIGGSDGHYCSNTAYLIEHGASGLFVESDYNLHLQCKANWQNYSQVRVQCCRVNGENVNAFVGDHCDILSTDTDGADYHIFKGLNARPKIVIVEIDSGYQPAALVFNSDGAASYRPMVELGIEKGYFLLCHTGNLVFMLNEYRELFPEIVGNGLTNAGLYFNRGWLESKEREVA